MTITATEMSLGKATLGAVAVVATLALMLMPAGCAQFSTAPTDPLVTIDTGQLRGARAEDVLVFRGIPYAAPPTGELRWRPPQPPVAWTGIRSAQDYGPMCSQPRSAMLWFELIDLSEDCLTLNVQTPDSRPAEPLPVMVWIHGGGFSQGTANLASLNGASIPRKGVVLVTVNYRLAVFGFLAHPSLAIADASIDDSIDDTVGNYGLLDNVAALEWVQRNISAFGGDPTRVTIFGESAGADVVNYLMVMPASRGLFQQAISQSSSVGMAPAPRLDRRAGFNAPAEQIANSYIANLDLPDTADLSTALRVLSTDELLAAMGERDRFTPVVDGRVLPDQPGLLFAAGLQHKVPYITGSNNWEASLGRQIGGGFAPAFAAKLVPAADKTRLYPELQGEQLDDAIFGDLVILSHSRFVANQIRAAGVPVYSYYMTYVASDRRQRQPGVAHTDDIAFVMGTLDAEKDLAAITPQDRAVSQLLTDYWVQFARTGNPNAPGLPEWPVYEPSLSRVLEIGDEVIVRDGLLTERMDYHLVRGQALLDKER